jgi:hypothetical protein
MRMFLLQHADAFRPAVPIASSFQASRMTGRNPEILQKTLKM